MNLFEAVATLTGIKNEELINVQIEMAKNDILVETNRTEVPRTLESVIVDIAVIRINRMGSEGETSRNQGGVSVSYADLPDYIHKRVKNYRLAGVGGHAFESKKTQNV